MECDVCAKDLNLKVHVYCTTCARAALYNLRVHLATALLEKETLGKHVEAVVSGSHDQAGQTISLGEMLVDTHESSKRVAVERGYTEAAESQERVRQITVQTDLLRRQLDDGKREILARRAAISQRRSDLESATYNIDERRRKDLANVKSAIRAVKEADDVGHRDDIRSKVWHCKHAAEVAGLKQRRRRTRDGQIKTEYYMGGVCVYDLRDLNNASPAQVTTSLNLLAGLVVRVANYLAIRLPAEITLAHKDYPLPTVFPPSSSYTYKDVPFPGSASQSSTNSPDASRSLDHQRPLPHPRPLYIDRKLPQLAGEDPVAFSLFVEGVTLLAWDIAWLCRSQGISSAFDKWEDICPLGKNVWRLLIDEANSTLATLESENAKARADAKGKSCQGGEVMMGYFSHGTSKGFLGGAQGTSFMKGWKFQTPARAIDKVKSYLLGEMQGAEWEVLDEKEWEVDEEITARTQDDNGSSVRRASSGTTLMNSSAGPGYGSTDERQGKARGTNGWTKLKSRNEEAR